MFAFRDMPTNSDHVKRELLHVPTHTVNIFFCKARPELPVFKPRIHVSSLVSRKVESHQRTVLPTEGAYLRSAVDATNVPVKGRSNTCSLIRFRYKSSTPMVRTIRTGYLKWFDGRSFEDTNCVRFSLQEPRFRFNGNMDAS